MEKRHQGTQNYQSCHCLFLRKIDYKENFLFSCSFWFLNHYKIIYIKNWWWPLDFFQSDHGALFAFGSDYYGCLGCEGEEEEALSPFMVDYFSDHPVQEVSCGDSHVIALTKYGDIYTWGLGEFGKFLVVLFTFVMFFFQLI